jgi:hypothetical protein
MSLAIYIRERLKRLGGTELINRKKQILSYPDFSEMPISDAWQFWSEKAQHPSQSAQQSAILVKKYGLWPAMIEASPTKEEMHHVPSSDYLTAGRCDPGG